MRGDIEPIQKCVQIKILLRRDQPPFSSWRNYDPDDWYTTSEAILNGTAYAGDGIIDRIPSRIG